MPCQKSQRYRVTNTAFPLTYPRGTEVIVSRIEGPEYTVYDDDGLAWIFYQGELERIED